MKPAFQKDAAFLADLAAAAGTPTPRLWWLGQSGFLLRAPRATVNFADARRIGLRSLGRLFLILQRVSQIEMRGRQRAAIFVFGLDLRRG